MQNLIVLLNQASKAYYQESREIMPNHEYDRLYDMLEALEKETGVTLSKSPTTRVGYEVLSDLPKEKHPQKMLSLDKTKDVEQLKSWLGDQEGVMSWKLDGLTIVLTYEEGKLVKAVTRGNGEVGEVITANARAFSNLPVSIPFKERLVLRGEAVISYPDFEKINETITDEGAKYKNPRNLCSGSVRQLNSAVTAERHVRFYAFALVSAEGMEFAKRTEQFEWLAAQGFAVVQHRRVTASNLEVTVRRFADEILDNINPSDGLVLSFDDIAYGQSLGTTAKFPRDSIAFKWRDEIKETTLEEIEWSASRTGLINPVAIFEPVELEGTTVSRASVHNISVMRELRLGIGDRIKVYKANMIIPQIAENLTGSNSVEIPSECPVCGSHTQIHNENGVQTLMCPNPECLAKQIKSFTHFVSRDAMNIEGLSEMTIEKLIARGMIKELADLFHVEKYRDEIVDMEGFGEKSFANLKNSIEKARNTTVQRFLYSLGIPNIGTANARIIAQHCHNSWQRVQNLSKEELMTIDGIGEVMADAFVGFFADPAKAHIVGDLLKEIHLDEEFEAGGTAFEGITFVITGSLKHYENREALKAEIEKQGGKVAGSVSAKTGYLINNDLLSQSGKNKKAKELGIKIIDEETIMKWLETGVTE
ncbi:MAG: NAD-dependent DNA ligase LigA [Firmicutes bacterium]|nr:NAD-dependent DNA ligase LigA [Bacillota bacterium]